MKSLLELVRRVECDGTNIVVALRRMPVTSCYGGSTEKTVKTWPTSFVVPLSRISDLTDEDPLLGRPELFTRDVYEGELAGLDNWLPRGVSPYDNFFGVNRSVDSYRLAGFLLRRCVGAATMRGVLIDALRSAYLYGGATSHIVVPEHWIDRFGLKTMEGPCGPVEFISAPKLQSDTAFFLQMETWCLAETSDGRKAFFCEAPGFNGRLTLDVDGLS
jgi:hypothetical protein